MSWMAWTPVTAGFFAGIALILCLMTFFELKSPSVERKGFLPLATSRGDRLFIILLSSAYVHLGFLAFSDANLLYASGASALLALIIFRWG